MSHPIRLHADLSIDAAREAEAIEYFETVYRPTASGFEGYIDLRLLKLQGTLAGSAPAGLNYRFSITFTRKASTSTTTAPTITGAARTITSAKSVWLIF
jgi:hypothetical protein